MGWLNQKYLLLFICIAGYVSVHEKSTYNAKTHSDDIESRVISHALILCFILVSLFFGAVFLFVLWLICRQGN